MVRFKAVIAYDGTEYAGWQIQLDQTAVTNQLKRTFFDVFKKDVRIIGASRTDAGVHALGQTALIITDFTIESEILRNAWQRRLPPTIVIRSLQQITESFHPQKNVQLKTYWYHFFLERPLPFMQRYGYFYQRSIDINQLQEVLQLFVGTHDFRSFCKADDDKDTMRTIESIQIRYIKKFKMYRIEVKGQRFLHFMIRKIVGTAFDAVTKNNFDTQTINNELKKPTGQYAFTCAPAKGLLLYKINYQPDRNC